MDLFVEHEPDKRWSVPPTITAKSGRREKTELERQFIPANDVFQDPSSQQH